MIHPVSIRFRLLACLLPVLLAACGSSSTGTADVAPPAQIKAGSTLIYWNDMAGAYPGIMTEWATGFEGKTRVKVEATGGVADYGNKEAAANSRFNALTILRCAVRSSSSPAANKSECLRCSTSPKSCCLVTGISYSDAKAVTY